MCGLRLPSYYMHPWWSISRTHSQSSTMWLFAVVDSYGPYLLLLYGMSLDCNITSSWLRDVQRLIESEVLHFRSTDYGYQRVVVEKGVKVEGYFLQAIHVHLSCTRCTSPYYTISTSTSVAQRPPPPTPLT